MSVIWKYLLMIVFEIIIVQQTTSYIIILLSCCNFICFILILSSIPFNWMIKKLLLIDHNNFFVVLRLQGIKPFSNQLTNLNIYLVFLLIFLIGIYSSQLFFWNQILIAQAVLHYLELIMLQLEHKVLYQLLKM